MRSNPREPASGAAGEADKRRWAYPSLTRPGGGRGTRTRTESESSDPETAPPFLNDHRLDGIFRGDNGIQFALLYRTRATRQRLTLTWRYASPVWSLVASGVRHAGTTIHKGLLGAFYGTDETDALVCQVVEQLVKLFAFRLHPFITAPLRMLYGGTRTEVSCVEERLNMWLLAVPDPIQ